ncbi:MAG: histidine--tRNA ligase, partial [Nitrospirota bacterium]
KITLRPEGTASVVRAYIEHNLRDTAPFSKLYYIGPMFRRERPQAGRYRQFYQIGAEVFGIGHYMIDAEIISMLNLLFDSLNIKGVELQINSIGCPQCRPAFREALKGFFADKTSELCDNCKRRFEFNPLRILDCKSTHCHALSEKAPKTVDYLCNDCLTHFNGVQESLKTAGVPYINNPKLVRGLDYYTQTTFEFIGGALGAQNAVAAGGRYDNLVAELGGPSTPAVGFSIGMERLFSLFDSSNVTKQSPSVFIVALGEQAQQQAFSIIVQLHKEGISTVMDYNGGSLKSQMRKADKLNSAQVIIIGEDELSKGVVVMRDMKDKTQSDVLITEVVNRLRK